MRGRLCFCVYDARLCFLFKIRLGAFVVCLFVYYLGFGYVEQCMRLAIW